MTKHLYASLLPLILVGSLSVTCSPGGAQDSKARFDSLVSSTYNFKDMNVSQAEAEAIKKRIGEILVSLVPAFLL